MKKYQKSNLTYSLLGLILFGLLASCDSEPADVHAIEAEKQSNPTQKKTNVEVLQLASQTFTTKSTYIGHLLPNMRLQIKSELEGVVEAIDFEEGGNVLEDQMLVQISTRQLTISQNQANSNFKLADLNFKRDQSLVKKNLVTPAQLEQTRNQWEVAFYALEQAKLNLEKAMIQAPFSGVVKSKNVGVGDFVNKGQLIAELLDIQQLKVLVQIPEKDLGFTQVDTAVDVTLDSIEGIFQGRVIFIGWEADTQSRSFPIEVLIDNSQRQLRAGMLARVQATSQPFQEQILIPRHTLLERVSGPVVYVIEENVAHARPVAIGKSIQDHVQVTSGLKLGDALVIRGQNQLAQGALVNIQQNHQQTDVEGRF